MRKKQGVDWNLREIVRRRWDNLNFFKVIPKKKNLKLNKEHLKRNSTE